MNLVISHARLVVFSSLVLVGALVDVSGVLWQLIIVAGLPHMRRAYDFLKWAVRYPIPHYHITQYHIVGGIPTVPENIQMCQMLPIPNHATERCELGCYSALQQPNDLYCLLFLRYHVAPPHSH